jgi:hypothetical protein
MKLMPFKVISNNAFIPEVIGQSGNRFSEHQKSTCEDALYCPAVLFSQWIYSAKGIIEFE